MNRWRWRDLQDDGTTARELTGGHGCRNGRQSLSKKTTGARELLDVSFKGRYLMKMGPLAGRLLISIVALSCPGQSQAHDFLAKAGVTEQTASGAVQNPASAATIPQSEVEFVPNVGNSKLGITLPAAEPFESSRPSLDLDSALPKILWKPSDCFGVGISHVLPAFTTPEIQLKRLPVSLLGVTTSADILAQGQSQGMLGGFAGWCLNKNISLGFGASYRRVGAQVVLSSSDLGLELLALDFAEQSFITSSGLLVKMGSVTLGLVVDLYQFKDRIFQPDFAGDIKTLATILGSSLPAVHSQSKMLLSSVTLGLNVRAERVETIVDVQYKRAPDNVNNFSYVDLTEKTKQLADSYGIRGGIRFRMTPTTRLLAGAGYQSSEVGPGGRGAQSLGGFGLTEIGLIYAQLEELTPAWQVSFGVEQLLGSWRIGTGVFYREASLTIPSSGELPGSFSQRQLSFPFLLAYKFGTESQSLTRVRRPSSPSSR